MAREVQPLPVVFAHEAQAADRSFRLHAIEPVPDGIRRVARGQLDGARDELSAATPDTLAEAVHGTRKRLKRLRATVRLSRDALGERTYEQENLVYRTAGRRLAAGRDAQVLLDTLDDLSSRYPDELPPPDIATLRERLDAERLQAARAIDDEQVHEVLAATEKSRRRTADWHFEHDDFGALSPGLHRIYRRGRKLMRTAQQDPSPENLHAWRKRVKDLWHASQIVREADPERLERFAKRAHKLADVLGDGHDLHVLREYAAAHPEAFVHEPARERLLAVVDRRSDELCAKALERGAKLYKRKPGRFVERVESGWRAHAATGAARPRSA